MENFEDSSDVGFLYKTMLTRDPRKRQVKPVAHHMLTLDFGGLDDSEDDDDYKLPQDKKGSSSNDDSEDSGDESDDEETEDEEDSDDDHDENDKSKLDNSSKNNHVHIEYHQDASNIAMEDDFISNISEDVSSITETTKDFPHISSEAILNANSKKKLALLVCSVCLRDYSEGDDEIVSCDGCGVTVHEACYGVCDDISIASAESSASTEPWFCDACKAAVVRPDCELCPNHGGILKQTDAGRWVHLVCALYIPDVLFGDTDKLSPVTIFEMPYSKWGAKECTLCEDVRFNRTGVCIRCDAGMCRNYFHVTCAQREGLLNDTSDDVEEIATPFYGYCKQHADKSTMKEKRRNWLTLKSHEKQVLSEHDQISQFEKERVHRKLIGYKKKFIEEQAKNPPSYMPHEKMPRLLTTSASALRNLMRKAELLGINTETQQNVSVQTDVSKKWHLPTAFSLDFVSYYHDRGDRILKMRARKKELLENNCKLQAQEKLYRAKYERLTSSSPHKMRELKKTYQSLMTEATVLWRHINALSKKKLKLPKYLKKESMAASVSKVEEAKMEKPVLINKCGTCSGSHDQHLLARCDTCSLHYHLACLKPPLTRMPKKSKLYGWECSSCCPSSTSDSDVSVDTSAPMRLRETIKEPVKFELEQAQENELNRRAVSDKKKRKRKPPKKYIDEDDAENEKKEKSPDEKRSSAPAVKVKKEVDVRTECSECKRPGDNSTLVRCDVCTLCYHFHCLDPPMKSSPKRRGYSWECDKCAPDSSDENSEDCASGDEVIIMEVDEIATETNPDTTEPAAPNNPPNTKPSQKSRKKQKLNRPHKGKDCRREDIDDEVMNILMEENDQMNIETAEEYVEDNYEIHYRQNMSD